MVFLHISWAATIFADTVVIYRAKGCHILRCRWAGSFQSKSRWKKCCHECLPTYHLQMQAQRVSKKKLVTHRVYLMMVSVRWCVLCSNWSTELPRLVWRSLGFQLSAASAAALADTMTSTSSAAANSASIEKGSSNLWFSARKGRKGRKGVQNRCFQRIRSWSRGTTKLEGEREWQCWRRPEATVNGLQPGRICTPTSQIGFWRTAHRGNLRNLESWEELQ